MTFDGTYVHYAYASSGISVSILYYRRGTPIGSGAVTWTAEMPVRAAATNYEWFTPIVAVDSAGYPFITYIYRWTDTSVYKPAITKSSTNNGTWTTASGFPQDLSATAGDWGTTVIPLTATRMYVLFLSFAAKVLYGKLWSGSSFGSAESVASSVETTFPPWPPGAFSAVNEGDHVHVAYLKTASYNLAYKKRTYGTGWGTESTIQSATTVSTVPVLSVDPVTSTLFCFWISLANYQLRYKKLVLGSWNPTPIVLIEGQGVQSVVTGDDLVEEVYGANCKSQSFTSLKNDYLTKLDIYAGWYFAVDDVLTVAIYAADAQGRPTGTALTSETITGTDEDLECSWQRVNLASPVAVTAGEKYCVVLSAPTAEEDYPFLWAVDSTSPVYTGGNWSDSVDSGASWTEDVSKDALFVAHFASELNNSYSLTAFYQDYGSIGVLYLSENETPYSLMFSYTVVSIERFASAGVGIVGVKGRRAFKFRTRAVSVSTVGSSRRGIIVSRFAAAIRSIVAGIAGTFVGFINTWDATDITQTTAKLHGYANRAHTGHGFSWGNSSGVYTERWCENGAYGAVEFEHTITGLRPNTVYYYKAKARTS